MVRPVFFVVELDRVAGGGGDEPCARLNERMLQLAGASEAVPPLWLADAWWRDARFEPLRHEARGILEAPCGASGGPHVMADPRLAYTLPLWLEAAGEAANCVVVHGPPDAELAPEAFAARAAAALRATASRPGLVVDRARLRSDRGERQRVLEWLRGRDPWEGWPACLERWSAAPETHPGRPLTPAQAELGAALAAAAPAGAVLAAERAVVAARLALERAILDAGFARQELLGRARAATEAAERELGELQRRRGEYEAQLAVAAQAVDELRARLRSELGRWFTLDDFGDRIESIRERLQHVDAVRGSWTFRLAMVLGWPLRFLDRVLRRGRGARP
ncbi:MAG: hypothetical protein IT458_00565 [Planctomycetes bacterium]|nr:hypothetical protein [Planctomycetota bacterium]